MEDIIQNKNLGEVVISNDVILSMIIKSISKINGIKKVYLPKKTKFIGIGPKGKEQVITIEKDEENALLIYIPISLEYGASIEDTAKKIQKEVKESIERNLDVKIKRVDIEIAEVEK